MTKMLQAARQGCAVIKEIYDSKICHSNIKHITEKENLSRSKDFQTLADVRTEMLVREILQQAFPAVGFFGEESSSGSINEFADAPYFILDPLDGTSNFIAGRDYFGFSLAYVENQIPKIGVIADPVTGDIIAAESEQGCFYYTAGGEKAIRLPEIPTEPLACLQIDFELPFIKPEDVELVALLVPFSLGMRKHGSTVADITFMARGRKSVLIASNQKPYDIAAALIIAQEIGLRATDWGGEPATLSSDKIAIANPHALNELLLHLKPWDCHDR